MLSTGPSSPAAKLEGLPPTFTTAQARRAALSSRDLAVLSADGAVDELSRGVYRRSDAAESAYVDVLAVCARAPHAVVCGETALALHELIDDIPQAVNIAVARGTHRPSISFPPVVVSQYSARTFALNIECYEVAPEETVPVYDAARSVVDAMRHRHRIGETLALSALGRYLRRTGTGGVADLQRVAGKLNAMSIIRPAVEAVIA
jgi:predicted transcriptional regulator of viral defense system